MSDQRFTYKEATAPDGKKYVLATDPATPGPYGMGQTKAEARGELQKALRFWDTRHETVASNTRTAAGSDGIGEYAVQWGSRTVETWKVGDREREKVTA